MSEGMEDEVSVLSRTGFLAIKMAGFFDMGGLGIGSRALNRSSERMSLGKRFRTKIG